MRNDLPEIRGQYRFDAPLAKTTWFQVGGAADVLFKPADTQDLAHFLKHKPADLPVTVLGVGSNLIIRDGGIEGVVIKLGRGFTQAELRDGEIEAGAALLDVHLARFSADQGCAGLEFFAGIPGTVGGALAMNAGAYGRETKDCLLRAEAVTLDGTIVMLELDEMRYSYRHYGGPAGLIFTRAWFATTPDAPEAIHARIAEIQASREATQPVRERTGGSTFKNPEGHKAWQLVDAAGCRGLTMGGAQISDLHCNFMLNTGNATAAELEALGEAVRTRVKQHAGVQLEWEIKRLGRF
ncbi:MAG: UDP-N-acetylenolpyruvoylglucosamine reductase [Azospirillum brasilense]|nr:MAG: UDP-N-acetylenolpyruvoylglucosamine reductase [Azospirillum brasilense]